MTESTEEVLNLETTDSARPWKRQKTEKAPPVEGGEKVLKTRDLTKLKDLFGKLAEDVNTYELSVEEANAEGYKEYIPAKATSKINAKKAEVLEKKTQLEQILDSGTSIYTATELRKMIFEIKTTTKNEHHDVKCRIATAKNDMAD